MLSFWEYIKEEKVKTGQSGDSAGKAFEVHVAKHIGHILRGGEDPEHHYPSHFSDESGDTPEDSVKKHKARLGDDLHGQIEHHARRMAHHIVNHMRKKGIKLDHTSQVHWTSKPKDLERLTGKKGVKGTADITVSHKGKHHGFSLKYSTSGTKPSLRSPGIKDLNEMLGADKDHVNKILAHHKKEVHRHVGHLVGEGSNDNKHENFKKIAKKHKKETDAALEASRDTHRKLAGHYADSFNKMEHEHKSHFIRKMIDAEEQPTIEPYRASYDAKKGSSSISNPTKDFNEKHKTVRHYEAEHNGATVNIIAHHHDGTKSKVTSFGIKNKGSTPYKGLGGRVADTTTTVSKVNTKKIIKRKPRR